jgi:two-component system sensor kinase FixL
LLRAIAVRMSDAAFVTLGRWAQGVLSRLAAAPRVRLLFALLPLWIAVGRWVIPRDVWAGLPYLLLTPSILLAGALGGAAPGLMATGIGLLCGVWLFDYTDTTRAVFIWQALVFTAIGVGAALFGEVLMRARKQADETMAGLRAREAHLQSILDTVPDAMIVIDERGVVQRFSRAAQRLFGYTPDEVIGRNVSLLMPSPYRENHDDYMARYARTGERRIIGIGRIVVAERKDGANFPIELAVGEFLSGQKRYFTGFVRDLSERQSTEARLQELQAELVHMSRLTALGELSSAIAHEINQPLSAIANYLKGVRRLLQPNVNDPADARVQDALSRASDQALRAGEIIRRLRDFVSRGETERHMESIAKIVEEASALALVGAKEYGVRVSYRLDPECDLVMADRVQVQQVLLNLMRNAVEAMSNSPERLLLVQSAPVEDDMAEIAVIDTGPGLAPEVASKLFQPFVTTKAQGMGVGLSICRTIIDAHGGSIRAEPNPAGGTIFRFTLRRVTEDADG